PTADTVPGEQPIELRQQLVAGHLRAIQRHRLAVLETDPHLQRLGGPLGARLAPADRALARRLPAIDLAAGHGQPEQVLVDRVGLLLGAHAEAALLQVGLLVGAYLGVLLLDLADRRHDAVVALGLYRQVEAHLVVAHAGAAVGDGVGAQFGGAPERGVHDQVAVRHQQRVLALVALAGPHERLDESVPDRRAAVDGDVAGHAELGRALLDELALVGVHAAGVGEHGMHPPAALLQVGHAEAGIQAAGEGEDDVFGIGDAHCLVSRWGPLPCIRESGRMRGTGPAPAGRRSRPGLPRGWGRRGLATGARARPSPPSARAGGSRLPRWRCSWASPSPRRSP